jgi:hypothetical protein
LDNEDEISPIYEEESLSLLSKDHQYVNGNFQRRLLEEELRLRSQVLIETP